MAADWQAAYPCGFTALNQAGQGAVVPCAHVRAGDSTCLPMSGRRLPGGGERSATDLPDAGPRLYFKPCKRLLQVVFVPGADPRWPLSSARTWRAGTGLPPLPRPLPEGQRQAPILPCNWSGSGLWLRTDWACRARSGSHWTQSSRRPLETTVHPPAMHRHDRPKPRSHRDQWPYPLSCLKDCSHYESNNSRISCAVSALGHLDLGCHISV